MRVGDWQIGVRTDDQEIGARLRADFDGLIERTSTPSPGYAVVAAPILERSANSSPLAELRAGPCALVRSRSVGRLGLATRHLIRDLGPPTPGLVRIRSAAIARRDRAVILPRAILWRPGLEARLRGHGLVLVDADTVEIDPTTRRLATTGWDLDANERLDVDTTVSVWFVTSDRLFASTADHPSTRLATAARHLVTGPDDDVQDHLDQIGTLAPLIRAVDDWPHDVAGLAGLLDAALDDVLTDGPRG